MRRARCLGSKGLSKARDPSLSVPSITPEVKTNPCRKAGGCPHLTLQRWTGDGEHSHLVGSISACLQPGLGLLWDPGEHSEALCRGETWREPHLQSGTELSLEIAWLEMERAQRLESGCCHCVTAELGKLPVP